MQEIIQNKEYISKYKNNNLKKFDLFFKLLFLLPKISLKNLQKIIVLIKKLSYNHKKKLIKKIYKRFNLFYKKYLIKFLVSNQNKKFKKNNITYKILGTFLFLQIQKKTNKGKVYLKFNKYSKKERLKYYDLVFFNQNLKDFDLYKSFFIKNSRIKWDLSKSTVIKNVKINQYKHRSIFIWPFTIIIKPFIIVIKNIFFRPFFIFKKWFEKIYNKNKYDKNKLYSQIYKVITIKENQLNLNKNIIYSTSTYFWYVMQKYYLVINNINYYSVNLKFTKNNYLFLRNFKLNKKYLKNKKNEYKKTRNSFFLFFSNYKKYLKKSFIGLSFFFRLYCLYFFWFIYFINNLYFFINRILFNYWFRFFYFIFNFKNTLANNLFISYKNLYTNLNLYTNFYEFENIINKFLINVINVIYYNYNYLLKIKVNNDLYKDYYLLLFYFYFKTYFFLNIFYNYKTFFNNNYKKYLKKNNNFFDFIFIDNYKYNYIYNLEYYSIIQKVYKKYPDYYKINDKKLLDLDADGKKDYLDSIAKRKNIIFLR